MHLTEEALIANPEAATALLMAEVVRTTFMPAPSLGFKQAIEEGVASALGILDV